MSSVLYALDGPAPPGILVFSPLHGPLCKPQLVERNQESDTNAPLQMHSLEEDQIWVDWLTVRVAKEAVKTFHPISSLLRTAVSTKRRVLHHAHISQGFGQEGRIANADGIADYQAVFRVRAHPIWRPRLAHRHPRGFSAATSDTGDHNFPTSA